MENMENLEMDKDMEEVEFTEVEKKGGHGGVDPKGQARRAFG